MELTSILVADIANADKSKNPEIDSYQHYVCGLLIGEEEYTVHSIVAVDNRCDRYYDHNMVRAEKEKLLDLLNQATDIDGFASIKAGLNPTTILEGKCREVFSLLQMNVKESRNCVARMELTLYPTLMMASRL